MQGLGSKTRVTRSGKETRASSSLPVKKLADHSPAAQEALTYFRNNVQRMRSDEYRAQGYMIGSGTVESACKQIVTRRLKCSGAQWTLQGAIQTAKARATRLSGEWNLLSSLRDRLPLAV